MPPRYTLTILQGDDGYVSVGHVLGVELEGDELRFWFEPTRIKTVCVLRLGDRFSLQRDS